ncbi:hypothetical protein A3862_29620 (plasmid) [Methylobacterium sp. XJLW]|nr:hypothetical protein A3862_29620 [Methylobacterium sp. XJLW]
MTEALTVPARIEAASRSVSSQSASMARTLTGPATSGRSVGHGSSGDRLYSRRSLRSRMRGGAMREIG